MSFSTDKQTTDDLNILGRPGASTIYNIYNNTLTRGGGDLLEKMFLFPLADADAINSRSQTIQMFSKNGIKYPFNGEQLDQVETYTAMTDERTMLTKTPGGLSQKINHLLAIDGDYKFIYNGIAALLEVLNLSNQFLTKVEPLAKPPAYHISLTEVKLILTDLASLPAIKNISKPSASEAAALDQYFRFKNRTKIKQLLLFIYELDVFCGLAEVAKKREFTYAQALDKELNTVKLTGLYHPLVKNAIANNIIISPQANIIFLTGANMAGKSTFMKSLGIALYLAHMGFPVPAQGMEFSVRDGIFTTINLPDNLALGTSHFYTEVLRLKKIAKELSVGKKLFIVFDELFRGTNVKDAYDGTIAVIEAFAQKQNSIFVISTHIIEAGDVLKKRCNNIGFVYLPTLMENKQPIYTYKLETGITADRHGMMIINNERILEIIRSRKSKTN